MKKVRIIALSIAAVVVTIVAAKIVISKIQSAKLQTKDDGFNDVLKDDFTE
jgi:hypothetical protein